MPTRLNTALSSLYALRSPLDAPPVELYRDCPNGIHGILTPLLLPSGRYVAGSCDCNRQALQERLEMQAQTKRRREMQNVCYGWLDVGHVAIELATKSFAGFRTNENSYAYQVCREYAQNFLQAQQNLIVYGPYGTGKTHLLAAICNVLLLEHGVSCRFLIATEFNMLCTSYPERKGELIQQAMTCKFLVIDDIDKVPSTDARESAYNNVINYRYNRGLPVAITTNTMQELDDFIGGAAVSRLSQGIQPLQVKGEDQRKTRRKQ